MMFTSPLSFGPLPSPRQFVNSFPIPIPLITPTGQVWFSNQLPGLLDVRRGERSPPEEKLCSTHPLGGEAWEAGTPLSLSAYFFRQAESACPTMEARLPVGILL